MRSILRPVNTPLSIRIMSAPIVTLAGIVRVKRMELGLSQEELAEAVGMSQGWVAKIEAGDIHYPRKKTLERMAFVLRVSFADLLIAAGYARSKDEADRLSASPDTDGPSVGDRLDAIYDALSPGERASIDAILKANERARRKAR